MIAKETSMGWVASFSEAYNMAIYSFTAPFLSALLFQGGGLKGVIFSYSLVLLASSIFYPLGAIYFGLMGDQKGRQKLCVYSTLGLAIATGLMGFVPIGEHSWILFLLLICIQHFFSGGEYHGSIVFSLEHSHDKKGGLLSGLSCLFAVFGLVAASGLSLLSGEHLIYVRGCFCLGGAAGILSYLLKSQCQETPLFATLPKESLEKISLLSFIKKRWKTICGTVSVLAFFSVIYTFIFFVLPLIHSDQMTFSTFQTLIVYGIFLVLCGALGDKLGLSNLLKLGTFLLTILLIPLSLLCHNLLLIQLLLTLCACLVIGPIHSWMLNQFETQERCRGIFMSSAIATALFGGSTIPICLILFETFHSLALCALYPSLISLIAFTYLMTTRKTDEILKPAMG